MIMNMYKLFDNHVDCHGLEDNPYVSKNVISGVRGHILQLFGNRQHIILSSEYMLRYLLKNKMKNKMFYFVYTIMLSD